jgi:leucyl-tRNA synthetase
MRSAVVKGGDEPVTIGRVEAMSKSKRNTVDPGAIIGKYGADTARWFILADNPPERDMEWTESGVAGAFRFTQRVWRLTQNALPALPPAGTGFAEAAGPARKLRQATHRTIAAVTEALETFAFNVAVARIHEFANAIADAEAQAAADGMGAARREALEILARLSAPMMPHLAEEVFAALNPGAEALVAQMPWPDADAALLKALAAPGEHGMVFTLVAGKDSDLLDGTLVTAAGGGAAGARNSSHGNDDHGHDHALERATWIGTGVAALGLMGGIAWWRQRRQSAGLLKGRL